MAKLSKLSSEAVAKWVGVTPEFVAALSQPTRDALYRGFQMWDTQFNAAHTYKQRVDELEASVERLRAANESMVTRTDRDRDVKRAEERELDALRTIAEMVSDQMGPRGRW